MNSDTHRTSSEHYSSSTSFTWSFLRLRSVGLPTPCLEYSIDVTRAARGWKRRLELHHHIHCSVRTYAIYRMIPRLTGDLIVASPPSLSPGSSSNYRKRTGLSSGSTSTTRCISRTTPTTTRRASYGRSGPSSVQGLCRTTAKATLATHIHSFAQTRIRLGERRVRLRAPRWLCRSWSLRIPCPGPCLLLTRTPVRLHLVLSVYGVLSGSSVPRIERMCVVFSYLSRIRTSRVLLKTGAAAERTLSPSMTCAQGSS